MSLIRRLTAALAGMLLLATGADLFAADAVAPLFDAHLHYNGDMRRALLPGQALATLQASGVRAIIATSTPNDGTPALVRAAEGSAVAVVPFLRPYRTDADRATWFRDPAIAEFVDAELMRENRYRGIGEFHLNGPEDASGTVVKHIVDVAVAKDLWLHAHCDDAALEVLFSHDARVKVIWAHTGFTTPPDKIARYLTEHPHLIAELSYRGDVAAGSKVSITWRNLFLRFPDRFIVGSDTWTAERWAGYEHIIDTYRGWLADLPQPIASRIRWENAARMFGLRQVK